MLLRSLRVLAALAALSSIDVPAGETAGRSVEVEGRAVLRVPPDQVLIRLTVDTSDDDLIRARENSDKDIAPAVASAGAPSRGRQSVSAASPTRPADRFGSRGSLSFRPISFRAADEETKEQPGKPENAPFALAAEHDQQSHRNPITLRLSGGNCSPERRSDLRCQ